MSSSFLLPLFLSTSAYPQLTRTTSHTNKQQHVVTTTEEQEPLASQLHKQSTETLISSTQALLDDLQTHVQQNAPFASVSYSSSSSSSSSSTPSLPPHSHLTYSRTHHHADDTLMSLILSIKHRFNELEYRTVTATREQQQRYDNQVRMLQELAAGGFAGAAARTVVAPFDRVKILMQTQFLLQQQQKLQQQQQTQATHTTVKPTFLHKATMPLPFPPTATATLSAVLPTSTLTLAAPTAASSSAAFVADKYRGILHSMRLIAMEEGLPKLWKGNLLNVIRVVPYSATQFAAYDWFKRSMHGSSVGKLNTGERLLAGAMAGMTATCLTHPLDVIRLRLSVHPELKGFHDSLRHVVSEGGARALFKGFVPTMLSVSPFIAINFASFDLLKQMLPAPSISGSNGTNTPTAASHVFLLGALSGLFAQSVCYPLDTIRRRMQLHGSHYDSLTHAFTTIVRQEGWSGFYKGMMPNAVKVVPNNAIRFVAYEWIKREMGLNNTRNKTSVPVNVKVAS